MSELEMIAAAIEQLSYMVALVALSVAVLSLIVAIKS